MARPGQTLPAEKKYTINVADRIAAAGGLLLRVNSTVSVEVTLQRDDSIGRDPMEME